MANQRVNNNIDITNIKRQWFANFSLRQLIFIGIALVIAFLVFITIGRSVGFKIAAIILAILLPPLFIVCETEIQNMPLEKYVWYKLRFRFLPQKRVSKKSEKGSENKNDKK